MADNQKQNDGTSGSPSKKELPKEKDDVPKSKGTSEKYEDSSKPRVNKNQEEPTPSTSRRQDPTSKPPNPYQKILDSGEDPKLIELRMLQQWQRDLERRERRQQREAMEAWKLAQLQAGSDNAPSSELVESKSSAGPSGIGKKKGLSKPQKKPEPQEKPDTPPEVRRRRRVVARWRCVVKKVIRARRNKPTSE